MSTEPLLTRRRLLTGRLRSEPLPIRPPWSVEERITSACSGCGICVTACPEDILLSDAEGRPVVDFSRGECTFCGACAEACAEPVFVPRHETAFSHVAALGETCLASQNVYCQSCGDACPETAIRFLPRRGGPPQPELIAERCTGCGACIAACPVNAVAIQAFAGEDACHG